MADLAVAPRPPPLPTPTAATDLFGKPIEAWLTRRGSARTPTCRSSPSPPSCARTWPRSAPSSSASSTATSSASARASRASTLISDGSNDRDTGWRRRESAEQQNTKISRLVSVEARADEEQHCNAHVLESDRFPTHPRQKPSPTLRHRRLIPHPGSGRRGRRTPDASLHLQSSGHRTLAPVPACHPSYSPRTYPNSKPAQTLRTSIPWRSTSPLPSLPPIGGGHLVVPLAAAALVAPALIWSSGLLPGASNLYRRRHRNGHALPLPISHAIADSIRITDKMPKSLAILEDIVQHTLSNLHTIHKSLKYWQSRAEGTDSQLMYFMMFQRGPEAFVEATCQALTSLRSTGSPSQYLLNSASDMFAAKFTALKRMQHCLSVFLSKVYSEVDACREGLTASPDQSLRTLIAVLGVVFPELEDSFRNAGNGQILATHDGNVPARLFKTLPEVHVGSSDDETERAISLIYENLRELDSFVSSEISRHRKPRNITIYWLPYTFGAIGLSACSLWLLRHSSLMGSSDMDNWIHDAKESVARFWDVHLAKPTISTRDLLLETFKRADKFEARKHEAQLTAESLRRMLLDFCEQTLNEKQPQDASEEALMGIVRKRYEEELKHPVQNMFSGELARTMLIEIQKHRVDLQQSLVELDRIVKATWINFAMLAALPTFGLSLLLLFPVRELAMHDQGAQGKGRIARRQRRQLLIQAEQKFMEFMRCKDNGMDEDACCNFGLAVYALDRLYNVVEFHAKQTGEWSRVSEDIFHLAMPSMRPEYKKVVFERLDSMYECLFRPQYL